jgi:hypothetical protein
LCGILFVPAQTNFKGEPEDGCEELSFMGFTDYRSKAALVVQLIHFWYQHASLVPKNIMNYVWLK